MSAPVWPYPGSRWWKFDFHTHTPASTDFGKGVNQDEVRQQTTPEAWLLAYMRAEVDCVAVTDHNSGEWINQLKDALGRLRDHPEFRPLTLFPGVEISVNEGIHILAILDPALDGSKVTAILGACGWRGEFGRSDSVTDDSAVQVVEKIVKAGGLAILAHVDEPKTGAFAKLSGATLEKLVSAEGIAAIEQIAPAWQPPQLVQQARRRWARVLGTDAHHLSGADGQQYPGSRYTWVKMAKPTLEGLRLALLDGEGVSIRRSDEASSFNPFQLPAHFVESVEIADFRYMGRGEAAKLDCNPAFNALIGGRGTGKSTVIHAMRLALRRMDDLNALPEKSEPRRTFARFHEVPANRDDDGGLTETSSVALIFWRDGVRHRLTWRQDGSGTAVDVERNGTWVQSESQTFEAGRFPVRLFSQGQIAALCEGGSRALLEYVDEAAGTRAHKEACAAARQRFLAVRAQIREAESQLKAREQWVIQWQDVERKLQRFAETQHARVLQDFQAARRQRKELEHQFSHVAKLADSLRGIADSFEAELAPTGTFDAASDQEPLAAIARLARAVADTKAALLKLAQELQTVCQNEKNALEASAWNQRLQQAENAYAELQRQLAGQGIQDPAEYGKLVQQKQRLEAEKKRLDQIEERKQQLEQASRAAYQEIRNARLALTRARQEFLEQHLAANPFVRINVVPWDRDPRSIEASLRELLGASGDKYAADIYEEVPGGAPRGLVAELLAGLPKREQEAAETIDQRIEAAKERLRGAVIGQGQFGAWFSRYLAELNQKRPEFADHIACWFPEDGLQVQYSRRGDGTDFHPITQASAGQRAAAMLAFLLAHGNEPLILDQPEDDLDNHLIYDLVVRQIRENKLRRQIIVVTHNPNIVVNGDAEMVHALDFRGGQCRAVSKGALQEKEVREEVCRVMEGGREALDRRYQRLGREL